ncbi:hypothetical protein G9A89_011695 [Geosiphon pyriformis]|nr:hypothetical protein G9A89_011695 [Geosiphon pyriformis]
MEVFKAKKYIIIVGNKWLKKTKALLDYELCKLIIRCDKKSMVVKYCHWTTPPISKQNQEEEQLDELDNNENNKKKDQEEQKKTAKFAYTIFTNENGRKHAIAYANRSLTPAKKNYSVTEQECLTVV